MPRQKREISEGSVYHVVQRGVGQQILFEDDSDRRFFLGLLEKHLRDQDGKIYAWCLMSNHIHLLVRMEMGDLSAAMKAIGISYARHFNDRYTRSGHLFQDRFRSEAVKDDSQLMATVRYIHANPLAAGSTSYLDFPWSSYASYLNPAGDDLVETKSVLDIFGGIEAFKAFHLADRSNDRCLETQSHTARPKLTEEQALMTAKEAVGASQIFQLKGWPQSKRDAALAELKKKGLSTRQIMRITGVSLGVISRAR